ncbi:MAG: hypothetical protein P4L50_25510 [Anaerolineaceae bacterium]|nr:hypothetical protein [Anaerolineaceae bacterium]
MIHLKYYFDLAKTADDENRKLMRSAKSLLDSNTPSSRAKALAMKPALEEARKKAEIANETYITLRDDTYHIEDLSGVLENKILDRATFESLDPNKRMEFIKQGGKVKD